MDAVGLSRGSSTNPVIKGTDDTAADTDSVGGASWMCGILLVVVKCSDVE